MSMTIHMSAILNLKWLFCVLFCIEGTFSRLFEVYFDLKGYYTRYPKYPKIPGFTRVLNFLVPEYPVLNFTKYPPGILFTYLGRACLAHLVANEFLLQ